MKIIIIIDLCLLILVLFLEVIKRLKDGIKHIYFSLSSWFENKTVEDSFRSEEEDEDEDIYDFGKYDVAAFRKRIEALKDSDGLYDIPFTRTKTDFTGTEIITESAEFEKDRRIGR